MRLVLILLLTLAGLIWLNRGNISDLINQKENVSASAKPDALTYSVFIDEATYHRQKLARQYINASNDQERDAVIQSSADFLLLIMPSMMKCWHGTPWDLNGMATTPGEGQIACGYFVSIIMRDAGFNINRIKLAQQASQNILRTFLPKSDLEIKVATDYSEYMERIRHKNDGIYIIGLDKHVGFIVKNNGTLEFIHSGGQQDQVVSEDQEHASSIRNSRYRVIGNITENKELIKKWLLNEPFITHF